MVSTVSYRFSRPIALLAALAAGPALADDAGELQALITADHRVAANIERNDARNPVETLQFFGLEKGMTVVEVLPGAGWYTEILAPFLRDNGTYYAAHFSANASLSYQPPALERFRQKLSANSEVYDQTRVTHLNPPAETEIAPAGSADLVLTFRNVHNWIMAGTQEEHFQSFYTALKPGGVLGVVEHRAPEGSSMEVMETTGYVTQAHTIELAEAAGFEFVEASEINANARDTADHPRGVWTLPPTLRLGDENRERYEAIGESDRMTLKFMKPQ
ncbi:methyltransferase [Pseudohongiella acticola]|uniref:Methyltransferase n=1 Tax=Pseudohongiella acticola TaxID=1524254 RepID=A0A1E8CF55_9GAMM|nr:class I SAM-dependent methyltransferase [Pseudohongiella acticola]OFE11094.1 methyltransferase [Pseudohongiella acticola]